MNNMATQAAFCWHRATQQTTLRAADLPPPSEKSHDRSVPTNPIEDPTQTFEAEVQQAVDLCGGDLKAALRASLIANAFLQAEVERLSAAVSTGYSRGSIRRRKKAGPA